MNKLFQSWQARKITLISTLIASLLGMLSVLIFPIVSKGVMILFDYTQLAKLSLILLLLMLMSWVILLIVLHPNWVRSKYLFDKSLGVSKHKKTGEYFCTKCLLQSIPVESQLQPICNDWFCRVCHEPYENNNNNELAISFG